MPVESPEQSSIDRALFWGALTVGLAPVLLFAGRPLWVLAIAALATGGMLAVVAIRRLLKPAVSAGFSGRLLMIAGVLWTIVIAYALYQAAPGSAASQSGGVWAEAARLTGSDFPSRGSWNAGATLIGAFRLTLYAAVCLLAYWTCRGRNDGWRVLWALMIVAAIAAAYGILSKVAGLDTVLWQDKRYYTGWATGPFENRNTFASFLALGLAANSALFMRAFKQAAPSEIEGRERVRVIVEFLSRQGILLILPGLTIIAAGMMTGSRAGLAVMAASVLLTVGVIVFRWSAGCGIGRALGAVAIIALIAGGLWTLGGAATAGRNVTIESSLTQRLEITGDTARAIAKAPAGGYGLGAFPEAMHSVKSTELTNDWRRAHNSYLELALEIGWPLALAAFIAIALTAAAAMRGLWTRYRGAPLSAAAGVSVIVLAGHSLIDFPLQEPGIALALALLLGAAAAQADGRS